MPVRRRRIGGPGDERKRGERERHQANPAQPSAYRFHC
jgi:hypothetical protein